MVGNVLKSIKGLTFNKKQKQLALVAVATLFAGSVIAGSGGAEFEPMYDQVADWLDGAPGKIIAILACGFGFAQVLKQNFIAALGAFFGCLVMANAKVVIESFLTAGIPMA